MYELGTIIDEQIWAILILLSLLALATRYVIKLDKENEIIEDYWNDEGTDNTQEQV
jgi:hypothetical protein